jgi:hypothetical protein
MVPDVLLVLQQVTSTLNELGIEYLVGGSVASSALGAYRYTNDIDIVVDLKRTSVAGLVMALSSDYYVDADMVLDAVRTGSSFSVLHLTTMMKVDVFIKANGDWEESAWRRRRLQKLEAPGYTFDVYIRTVEDMILQKLRWYRLGREVSDRQWGDVIGMLEVQSEALDYGYLEKWAQTLNVTDPLHRAYSEIGRENS